MSTLAAIKSEFAGSRDAQAITSSFKRVIADPSLGYLHLPLFRRMEDGRNDGAVRAWFLGPFAENRSWFLQMLATFLARFSDHACAAVVFENFAEEFGVAAGVANRQPSHSGLFRRILDAAGVPVADGTVSTPREKRSAGSRVFYRWFEERMRTRTMAYTAALLWAYEVSDPVDFQFYLKAATRIWGPDDQLLEFFTEHAKTTHEISFGQGLQPLIDRHADEMIEALCELQVAYTLFYRATSEEVGA